VLHLRRDLRLVTRDHSNIAEQNIAKLFQAALVPGMFAVVLYCLVIRIVASRNPRLAPIHEKADGERRVFGSLLSVWPALLVILVVLGGIYSGIFTTRPY